MRFEVRLVPRRVLVSIRGAVEPSSLFTSLHATSIINVPLHIVHLTDAYWQRVVAHCVGEIRSAAATPPPISLSCHAPCVCQIPSLTADRLLLHLVHLTDAYWQRVVAHCVREIRSSGTPTHLPVMSCSLCLSNPFPHGRSPPAAPSASHRCLLATRGGALCGGDSSPSICTALHPSLQINIPLHIIDVPLHIVHLTDAYWQRVVTQCVGEIRSGRTPNPDMLCNSRIKFGAFYDHLDFTHFDRVASGHYARVVRSPADPTLPSQSAAVRLVLSADEVKDQTYFLSHLSQQQLSRVMFPLGALTKSQVRQLAAAFNLPNQSRKDSQGICFLGKVKFPEFVARHVGEQEGLLVEAESGEALGVHRGFWFFTIGQRQGIKLSGGPWYVVAKDTATNTVFVSRDYHSPAKSRRQFWVGGFSWTQGGACTPPLTEQPNLTCKVRHGPQGGGGGRGDEGGIDMGDLLAGLGEGDEGEEGGEKEGIEGEEGEGEETEEGEERGEEEGQGRGTELDSEERGEWGKALGEEGEREWTRDREGVEAPELDPELVVESGERRERVGGEGCKVVEGGGAGGVGGREHLEQGARGNAFEVEGGTYSAEQQSDLPLERGQMQSDEKGTSDRGSSGAFTGSLGYDSHEGDKGESDQGENGHALKGANGHWERSFQQLNESERRHYNEDDVDMEALEELLQLSDRQNEPRESAQQRQDKAYRSTDASRASNPSSAPVSDPSFDPESDPIQAASLAAERSLAAVAGIAAECLERELSRFEVNCPPGGEQLVVLYVTSLEAVRKTHADCVKMRALLK
ncbi:unnamed protein product, partial [Closterium sp. Yama58-4]